MSFWMPHYAGEPDVHAGGFDYVRTEGYGHELFNFKDFGGTCYGYVQAKHIINIVRLGAESLETFIEGVTVVWTAPRPDGNRVVVGWYRMPAYIVTGKMAGFRVVPSAENA